jgi:hypothetical protein
MNMDTAATTGDYSITYPGNMVEFSTTIERKCSRCGRTDLPLLSNGLCVRCDEVQYGRMDMTTWPVPVNFTSMVIKDEKEGVGK